MRRYPAIHDCAIIAVPGEMGEEDIRAFDILKEGQTITLGTFQAHCAERMARFMVPKHIVVLDEMPRTPTGKPEKGKLALT